MDLVIAGFSQVSSAPAAACAGGADTESPATATLFAELLDQLGVADAGSAIGVQEGANVSTVGEAARGRTCDDPAIADGAPADTDDEAEEDDAASDVMLFVCTAQPCHVQDAEVPVAPRIADSADFSGPADRGDLPDLSRVADGLDSPELTRASDRSGVSDSRRGSDLTRIVDPPDIPAFTRAADLSQAAHHVDSPNVSRAWRRADSADLPGVADRADLPELSRGADRADVSDSTRTADDVNLSNFPAVAKQPDLRDSTRVVDHVNLPEITRGVEHTELPDFTRVEDVADSPDFSRPADRSNLPTSLTHARSDQSALPTEMVARDADRQPRVQVQPHYARALAKALAGIATERSADVPNANGRRVHEPGTRVDEPAPPRTAVAFPSVVAPVAQSQLAGLQPIAMPEARQPLAGEHEIVPQLVRAMHAQFRAGVGEARIRLNPEHLGEVRVAIKIDGDRVSALLEVERPEVQRAIESQSDSLRTGLAAQGLTLEHLSVSREDRARHHGGDDLDHRGRDREQQMPQRRSKKRSYDEVFDISDD